MHNMPTWLDNMLTNVTVSTGDRPGHPKARKSIQETLHSHKCDSRQSDTVAVSQFRVCILRRPHLKASYVTMLHEGCPNLKAPSNAALFSLFLEDAPLLSFMASHIPRFFVRPKKKKERKRQNGDIKWCRSSLSLAWAAEWWKGKNIWWCNQEMLQRTDLTKVDVVNKVSLKDSPSKASKAASFEGCRPWIETQHVSKNRRRKGSDWNWALVLCATCK